MRESASPRSLRDRPQSRRRQTVTNEELETHLHTIGYVVERLTGADGISYLVIRDYTIRTGSLAGTTCDVAIQWATAVPYIMPPAIHTRPVLIPMGTRNTQASGVGPEWQYWSRVLRGRPTPATFVAHLATIFSEV